MSTTVRKRSHSPGSKEGFAHSIEVELLFGAPPEIDWRDLETAGPFRRIEDEDRLVFRATEQPDHDARWVVELPFRETSDQMLATSLRQSWSWPEARTIACEIRHAVTIRDLRATGLEYRDRIRLLNQFVASAAHLAPPLAIHWVTTEQLVDPRGFLVSLDHEGPESLFGAVNIRLFRIDRDESDRPLPSPEIIMDTLGLTAVGLDDFQIHTREYDPHDVGNYLYAVAQYSWQKGAVISAGDVIVGIDGDQWKCEMEDALVEPDRAVIDIDTDEPGLAGRKR